MLKRILIDECLDKRLAKEISQAFVRTVTQMGWAGLTNGNLLTKAQEHFDFFVTNDQNLSFQQNLKKYKIVVIVLSPRSNKLEHLKALVPKLLVELKKPHDGIVYVS